MSNLERADGVRQLISMQAKNFTEIAKIHGAVDFKIESVFALQVLNENEYLMRVAMGNQDSLKKAIINVATIGLTLNPAQKLAYLVPRNQKICLDPSYRGLIHLGINSGGIKWASAEIVRQHDTYEFLGHGREPVHRFNPFDSARGEIVGAYCIAKTTSDEFMVTQMPIAEIYSIRDRSESWKAYKAKGTSTPWKTDESEMIKKTVVRRAYKYWPMTAQTKLRLDTAVHLAEENDPIDVTSKPALISDSFERAQNFDYIRSCMKELKINDQEYFSNLTRILRREIKSLDELTDIEINQVITLMDDKMSRLRNDA